MKTGWSAVLAASLWLQVLASLPAAAQERVSFPSLDGSGHAPVVLTGFFIAALSTALTPAPAIALFHGCGGVYDRHGSLSQRMRDYAALFNELGMHALVVDSLTPRYEKEICTQRTGSRRVTVASRRLDALGAVAYLVQRKDVDPARIGLVGWSHGGSTVLGATNRRRGDVAAALALPSFAIAFYPGCESELKRGYEPLVPLLMLVGELDDWTPAAPCRELAKGSPEPKPEIESYVGAWHGFDSSQPVRLRTDVPNGVNPGQGVHVGGNPVAARAARQRLLRFLAAR